MTDDLRVEAQACRAQEITGFETQLTVLRMSGKTSVEQNASIDKMLVRLAYLRAEA